MRPAGSRDGKAGTATATGMPGFGERIGQAAAASFRCAACGEMAGVVKVARAGTTVDDRPARRPGDLKPRRHNRGLLLRHASRFADAAILDAVQAVVSSQAPDPVALRGDRLGTGTLLPELGHYLAMCGIAAR